MLKKTSRNLACAYWHARARLQFLLLSQPWPKNLRIRGPLGLSNNGKITIGSHVTISNLCRYNRAGINHPTQIAAYAGATLTIGNSVGMSGASIVCAKEITIGNHVLLGVNASIYDTDFHSLHYLDRRHSISPTASPVVIEDDVWVCANAVILKGSKVGARAVIAANSVVSGDIPPDVVAAGVPARPIKRLDSKRLPL